MSEAGRLFSPEIEDDAEAAEATDGSRPVIYTDGACIGNPGPGGWGWAHGTDHYASGAEPKTTNQRMELTAVIEALRAIPGQVEIVSDSTYVVNCFRDRWWQGWRRRGWKNSKGVPVANRDLWESLVAEVVDLRGEKAVAFRWVKGHAGEEMNEFVDLLATTAARSQQGVRVP
ncbi:MAG TPA: ribonuclease H [Acidimicrobiales bacterium]